VTGVGQEPISLITLALSWNFRHPSRVRHTDACNNNASHQHHAGFKFYPHTQQICDRCVIAFATLLGPLTGFTACTWALMPSPVPAGIRQHGFQLGQLALLIHGHTSRTINCFLPDNMPHLSTQSYLLLPSPRLREYLDHTVIVFPPPHLLCFHHHIINWINMKSQYCKPVKLSDATLFLLLRISIWIWSQACNVEKDTNAKCPRQFSCKSLLW